MAAFRVPAELHGVFNQAVAAADCDKTAWLLVALRSKLNQPDSNPQMRMFELVERMEVEVAALAGDKQGITPTLYNEAALIGLLLILSENGSTMAELSLRDSMRPAIKLKQARRGIRTFTAPGNVRGTTQRNYQ
ncbi:hypothetical protein KLPMCK396B_06530 [Klebsiella pneumoniae]|nr:Uncharacterised protein [Klebsiella pneumoniae]